MKDYNLIEKYLTQKVGEKYVARDIVDMIAQIEHKEKYQLCMYQIKNDYVWSMDENYKTSTSIRRIKSGTRSVYHSTQYEWITANENYIDYNGLHLHYSIFDNQTLFTSIYIDIIDKDHSISMTMVRDIIHNSTVRRADEDEMAFAIINWNGLYDDNDAFFNNDNDTEEDVLSDTEEQEEHIRFESNYSVGYLDGYYSA